MTTRLTTAWASAITPLCLKAMRRAFHQVRKCLTTCHSLIKAPRGMSWMTRVLTQTPTQRKPPTMYEAQRSRGLFELLLVQYIAYLTCILSTTCSYCNMQTHIAHPRTIQQASEIQYRVHCCTGHSPSSNRPPASSSDLTQTDHG